MEEINLVGEGGEDYKLTPIQAANLFAEKYLPDLDTKSVSLPREIIDHGTTPQGFDLPEIERNQIASSMVGNERNEFIQFGKHLKGSKTELSVVKYVQGSMKGLSATFWSYKQLKTYRFLGVLGKKKNKKTGKLEDCTWYNEQEYDIILILPRYKIFVVVEVKSYKGKLQAKTLDPLITGHDFFTLLLTNFGDETWKYIPVVALPNVQNRVEAENLSTKKKLDYVLVTAEEMRKNFLDVLTKDKKLKEDYATEVCVDEIYKNLVKIMFASAHSQDVSKLRGNIGIQIEDWKFTLGDTEFRSLLPDNPFDRAHERLIGEGEETVSAGFNHNLALPEYVNFSDIKGKAVSDLKSLIFWNPSQFEIINSNPKKLMISGEFGTGKTLLLMAIVQKHIINNEKVMFICDSSNSSKLFDSKIRNFCNLRDIEFHSMNVGGERDTFESLLQRQRENHLVVDELDPKCSTNLVFITTVKDISSINLEKWDLFIPYEQKSRHYKQRINEMENNIDIVDSIQRTLHRTNIAQCTEEELEQINKKYHRYCLQYLLEETSVEARRVMIQKEIRNQTIKELSEDIRRWSTEGQPEETGRLELLLEEFEKEKSRFYLQFLEEFSCMVYRTEKKKFEDGIRWKDKESSVSSVEFAERKQCAAVLKELETIPKDLLEKISNEITNRLQTDMPGSEKRTLEIILEALKITPAPAFEFL